MKYNSGAAPAAMRSIARALGEKENAPGAVWDLEKSLGLALRLADIGMKQTDIERAAKIATEAPYPNPRKVEYGPLLELLRAAYEGRRPAA
jgi:alcohol dehydrogenase class IV